MDWIRRWGWVVLVVVAGVVVYVLTASKIKLPIRGEIKAAKADAKAAKLEATLGRERAVMKIKEEHRATLEKLGERQKKQAEELKDDPRKLSRWLSRIGSG